jgi:hypothetical protein
MILYGHLGEGIFLPLTLTRRGTNAGGAGLTAVSERAGT